MEEVSQIYEKIIDLQERATLLRKNLNLQTKKERLEEIMLELENKDIWSNPEKAKKINQEKNELENICLLFDDFTNVLNDAKELIDMSLNENDKDLFASVNQDIKNIDQEISKLEFAKMFSGKMDKNSAYLDIQSGSGGTEAQDWAEMILRMYLRWSEKHKYKTDIVEISQGEVAGIKSATIHIQGEYAFGWLKSEIGIHRLVRKSPYNANGKRHTSFSSVFVSPEINSDIEIDIKNNDIRIDTYRASGAGGQHVNKTDSAVRITHIPTNTVVQCQNGRSQHSNKDHAMKQLKSKLYEIEMHKLNSEKQNIEDSKSDIGWGQQIRSYVLDQSRIKDIRTGMEINNTQGVLDGDLDDFIIANLKAGI